MLSAYIRKGAGGKEYFVIGYWCEFCDGLISEIAWSQFQDGTFKGYALWSFSERKPFFWMKKKEFKEKMKELRLKKIEQLKELREKCLVKEPEIIPLIDKHIKRLKGLLKLS